MAYSPEVSHLPDDRGAYRERLRLIATARSSIVLATYSVQAGPEVTAILDALIAKAKQGVAVCFKFDAEREFAFGASEDIKALRPKFRELEAAGGGVFGYGMGQQVASFGSGDHIKGLIVDGKTAIVGGRNFGVKHFNGTYGDYDVEVGGSAAPEYAAALFHTLQHAPLFHDSPEVPSSAAQSAHAHALLDRVHFDYSAANRSARSNERMLLDRGRSPGTRLAILTWDPTFDRRAAGASEHPNAITQAFIETIDRAQSEIILNCNSFNPGEQTVAAICRAARRGVKVHILTASPTGAGISPLPYFNAMRIYPQLIGAGVHIWESQRYQHEKLFVVDNALAVVGSYNFEPAAEEKLKEQSTFSADPSWVKNIRSFLVKTLTDECKPYTPQPEKLSFWHILFFPFWKLFVWLEKELAYAMRTQF